MDFEFRGRSIEVEGDVSVGVFVALTSLNNLDDAVHPLLHVLAGDRVQKHRQLVQQVGVLVNFRRFNGFLFRIECIDIRSN